MDVWTCQSCVPVFKCQKVEQIEWWNGITVHCKGKRGKFYKLCWFSKICHVIKWLPDLKQTFGKEDMNFPLSLSSRAIECKKNLSNLEQYLDLSVTGLYKDFRTNKNISRIPSFMN